MKNVPLWVLIIAILASLGVGFFGGSEYKANQIRTSIQKVVNSLNTSENATPSNVQQDTNPAKQNIITKNIGDEVELATLTFKVSKVEEKPSIQGSYGSPTTANQGAKFVVLEVSATNILKDTFDFTTDGFVLMDSQGRKFNAFESIGKVDNYIDMRKLSPNISEAGVMVYEIPTDATSYSLTVGKASSNDTYKIILK
jgi:hypothetical protein